MRRGIATPPATPTRHESTSERDWAIEARYWRAQFVFQPYYELGRSFDFYAPAYRAAFEASHAAPGTPFEALEPSIRGRLDEVRHHPDLDWPRARPAARAAWLRAERGRRTLS